VIILLFAITQQGSTAAKVVNNSSCTGSIHDADVRVAN
jgi:hypothetical protein